MAQWTQIPDATFDPDRPILGSTHLAIVRNFEAMAEGAEGAPRVYLMALERLEPGDEIRSRKDDFFTTAEIEIRHSFSFIQYGQIRASIEKSSAGGLVQIRRLRNDIFTTLVSSDAIGVLIADVNVIPGDKIFLRTTGIATAGNARFSTNGQDLWPGNSAILEGNRSAT